VFWKEKPLRLLWISLIKEETGRTEAVDGRYYKIGGLIDDINIKITKRGDNMAFLRIEDWFGTIEVVVVVFPDVFEKNRG
jgi:DNA polymerase III, alpha subunit